MKALQIIFELVWESYIIAEMLKLLQTRRTIKNKFLISEILELQGLRLWCHIDHAYVRAINRCGKNHAFINTLITASYYIQVSNQIEYPV